MSVSDFAPAVVAFAVAAIGVIALWWMERTKPVLIRAEEERERDDV